MIYSWKWLVSNQYEGWGAWPIWVCFSLSGLLYMIQVHKEQRSQTRIQYTYICFQTTFTNKISATLLCPLGAKQPPRSEVLSQCTMLCLRENQALISNKKNRNRKIDLINLYNRICVICFCYKFGYWALFHLVVSLFNFPVTKLAVNTA